MRITLQVARIKVDLLVSELILLSLELEELFTIHDGPSRRASTRTAATASRERNAHTLGVHLCSGIKPSLTLCL